MDLKALLEFLLYHHGLYPADPNGDLAYYTFLYGRRLGSVVYENARVRSALLFVRSVYVSFALFWTGIHVFVISPLGVYVNLHEPLIVVENLFFLGVSALGGCGLLELFRHQQETKVFLDTLFALLDPNDVIDKDYCLRLEKVYKIGSKLMVYPVIITEILALISMITLSYVDLIPNRRLYVRGWYPYDVTSSPQFELTLALESLYFIIAGYSLPHLSIFVCTTLYVTILNFTYLGDKFTHIRRHTAIRLREEADEVVPKEVVPKEVVPEGRPNAFSRPHARPVSLRASQDSDQRRGGGDFIVNVEGSAHSRLVRLNKMRFEKALDVRMIVELKKLVQLHLKIQSVATRGEAMTNLMAFLSVICFVAGAGVTAIMLFEAQHLTVKEMMFVFAYVGLIITEFTGHMASQYFKDESGGLNFALYDCEWTGASEEFKKAMLVIMTRTSVPFEFKPPGCNPFGLEQFSELSKQAYQMIATLNQLLH